MGRFAGSRKLLITLVVFLSSILLLVIGTINADQWTELNKFVIPSFMAANLAEYVMNRSPKDGSSGS